MTEKTIIRRRHLKLGTTLLSMFALAVTLAPHTQAGKLYKIVDENGKITFSQFPPKEKAETDKVEDISVKTSGGEKLAVRTLGDAQYCGDIRLTDRGSRSSRSSDNHAIYLDRRMDEWQQRLERYEKELEQISNRQFDRSTAKYAKHESSTQKNSRYKQYQASHNRILENLRQYRCAIDWVQGQLKESDGTDGIVAVNKEVKRLKAVYEKLETQLQRNCGVEPPFDPSTAQAKAKTQRWESCAKTYKKDMRQVRNRIRSASVNARY